MDKFGRQPRLRGSADVARILAVARVGRHDGLDSVLEGAREFEERDAHRVAKRKPLRAAPAIPPDALLAGSLIF